MYLIEQWNHPHLMYLLIPVMICMMFTIYAGQWRRFRAAIVDQTLNPKAERLNFRGFIIRGVICGFVVFVISTGILVILPKHFPLAVFSFAALLNVCFCVFITRYLRHLERTLNMIRPEVEQNVYRFSREDEFISERYRDSVLLLSIFLMILVIMGPEGPERTTKLRRAPLNVTVAFDLSRSMDAQDYKPSRLNVARDEVKTLLERGIGDEIGLVYFTDTAILRAPQTLDINSLQGYLDSANTSLMPTHGTDLAKGLEMALRTFDPSRDDEYRESNHATRRVVLVTDGESHSGELDSVIRSYMKRRIHIDVLAIGSENGAEIPTDNGSLKYEKETVISRLQADVLQDIAKKTGGTFVRYSVPEQATDTITANWDAVRIKAKPRGVVSSLYRVQLYHYFLYPALILLMLYIISPLMLTHWRARHLEKKRMLKAQQEQENDVLMLNHEAEK